MCGRSAASRFEENDIAFKMDELFSLFDRSLCTLSCLFVSKGNFLCFDGRDGWMGCFCRIFGAMIKEEAVFDVSLAVCCDFEG